MYSYSQCKQRTYLCGSTNYPISCKAVLVREQNLWKFGPTFRHGAVLAPKQCLYHKEARAMESPKMYSSSRCKKRTYLCGFANYPVSLRQYVAENGNLGKSVATFRHGAVFAPKQCFYRKEARAMENPKMHSSSWWKKRTYLCGSANYPVLCKAVYG